VTTLARMAPDGPPARANPARGLALIATAVILGFFILRNGLDVDTDLSSEAAADNATDEAAEEDVAEGDEPGDEGDGNGDDAGDAEGDEPAQPELRAPSEVTVRVANTTGVGGAAGTLSTQVETNGYAIAEATDSAERDRAETVIYYRDGYEAEARALADAIAPEGTSVQVEAAPADPPMDRDNAEPLLTDETHLLVLLGADLAGGG
jgi:hypothetical protein